MLGQFIRKILLTAITLLILSLISYVILLRDPLNDFADSNIVMRYVYYLTALVQGDLGISYISGEPLTAQILAVFPATLSLCLSALLLALVLGLPLGLFAAQFQHTTLGKLLTTLGSFSFVFPVFWLAALLLYYASVNQWEIAAVGDLHPIYEIRPLTGFKLVDISLSESDYQLKMMQSALHHLALPSLVLGIPATLEVMRLTQNRAIYVMKQSYMKVALTRGWSSFKIWRTHVLGNTLPALVPLIAHLFTVIFAFEILIENIFSISGIGRWLINALMVQDYNAISAASMAIGIFVLSINLLSGLMTTLLDPAKNKDWYV